jgi:hypothetical protein
MHGLSTAALAGLLCASALWGSAVFAQDLVSPARRAIEAGPVDVAQLTQRARLIVHGVVTSKQVRWIGRVIYTQYELAVQETLKGQARSNVLVAVAGGTQGNVRLTVPGRPDLQLGEQFIFFGVPLEREVIFTPVGTFDGIVRIRPGNRGSAATVAPRGTPEELEAFLQEVRTLGRRR